MSGTTRKILFLITKSNFGGAQRYVYDLATSLPKDRFDAAVAFGGQGLLAEKLKAAGVRTITIDSLHRDIRLIDEFKVLRELVRLFRAEKPDIIHLNSSKIGGLGALAGRIARVPAIVYTSHGWASKEERPAFSRFLIRCAEWATVILAHKTIDVSESTASYTRSLPFAGEKISVIHNGIVPFPILSAENARAELISLCPALAPFKNQTWIGSISELHPNKGLDYMIESLPEIRREHEDTIFICLGDGEKRSELEAQIAKECPGAAYLLGFVPEARKYLNAFDIVTLTSRKEGFPYLILEAGLAGRPIVASHVGGIPEIIDDMKSGILIKPYTPDDISHAIEFLIEHPEKRAEFGKTLQKSAATTFSLEHMLEETILVYNEVLQ